MACEAMQEIVGGLPLDRARALRALSAKRARARRRRADRRAIRAAGLDGDLALFRAIGTGKMVIFSGGGRRRCARPPGGTNPGN